jgi:hypothetical protein
LDALLAKEMFCDAAPLDFGAKLNEKAALCPEARVSGNERPLIENGALMEGAEEMVTLAPDALKVAVFVALLPTATLPKLIDVGEIESCGVVLDVPVPLSAITVGVFEASLANEMFCEAAPLVFGAKLSEKAALCPAARVSGYDRPLMENGALMEGAEERVTLAPAAVRVADLVRLLPTITLPKFIDVGEIESSPCGVSVVPVPLRAMFKFELLASDRIAMLPLEAAADFGANATVKVTLCPAARVAGKVRPVTLNVDPVIVAPVRLRAVDPGLFRVSDCVCLVPILTEPKLMALMLACSCAGVEEFPELNP